MSNDNFVVLSTIRYNYDLLCTYFDKFYYVYLCNCT